jgi:hypothetical protein
MSSHFLSRKVEQGKGGEKARYKPFVKLANAALEKLRDHPQLNGLSLKPCPKGDEELVFWRNDPCHMESKHTGAGNKAIPKNWRIPDVNASSLCHALRTMKPERSMDWASFTAHHAGEEPSTGLTFDKIYMCLEFKWGRDLSTMPEPPPQWKWEAGLAPRPLSPLIIPQDDAGDQRYEEVKTEATSQLTDGAGTSVPGSRGTKRSSESVSEPESGASRGKRKKGNHGFALQMPDGWIKPSVGSVSGIESNASRSKRQIVAKRFSLPMQDGWTPLHPTVQSALYASERLCSSVTISHTLGVIIKGILTSLLASCLSFLLTLQFAGDGMWVWWYDRGGALQTEGFSIVSDLPFLVTFLAILQRFSKAAWGILPELEPLPVQNMFKVTLNSHDGQDIDVAIDAREARQRLGLMSRATVVAKATSESPNPLLLGKTFAGMQDLVVKISWPEKSRTSEVDLLRRAYCDAAEDPKMRGHIPVALAWGTWDHSFTSSITATIDVSNTRRINRCLRIILFVKLNPITQLSGIDFMKAYWDCFESEHVPSPSLG